MSAPAAGGTGEGAVGGPRAVPDHDIVGVDGVPHGAVAEPVAVAHHSTAPALQAARENPVSTRAVPKAGEF